MRKLAQQTGSQLINRYRHERVPFQGMDNADEAAILRRKLEGIQGMLHANVNYAAGLAFVAYDTKILQPRTIAQIMRGMGASPINWPLVKEEQKDDHDHSGAPSFLPHWVQERWTLILIGMAGLFFLVGWLGEILFEFPANISLAFFVLSILSGGYDIARHAVPGIFKGNFDTDVLMMAAAAGAAILGEWAESAFLLFLFGLGHAGEHYALGRARNAANALGELMPKTARLKKNGQLIEMLVEELKVDDIVLVRPGDRIPADGLVSSGESKVDQSSITGESVPVQKISGDEVFAGTINQDAALEIKVTRMAQDNTLARVMQMVAEAQSQQSPTQ